MPGKRPAARRFRKEIFFNFGRKKNVRNTFIYYEVLLELFDQKRNYYRVDKLFPGFFLEQKLGAKNGTRNFSFQITSGVS